MKDDENQDLYKAMRSNLATGECALLDDSRSSPTVVRFCRQTLGVIDGRPEPATVHLHPDCAQRLPGVRKDTLGCRSEWPMSLPIRLAVDHVNDNGNVTLLSGSGREIAAWV